MSDLDTTTPVLPETSCGSMVKIVMSLAWRNVKNG